VRKFKTLEAYFETWDAEKKEDMFHEFIWYVGIPLTMEQWIVLDAAMGNAFEAAGISQDDVVGIAGPIPFDMVDEEETNESE